MASPGTWALPAGHATALDQCSHADTTVFRRRLGAQIILVELNQLGLTLVWQGLKYPCGLTLAGSEWLSLWRASVMMLVANWLS